MRTFVFACILFVMSASEAYSQLGGLRGTVRDADFGVPVPGANVRLDGPSQQTVTTDEDGNFVVNGIEPGTYLATASAEGYVREIVRDILVVGGSLRDVTLNLTAQVYVLDEFVVTGEDLIEEDTKLDLLDIQLDVDSVVSVIGADFISQSGASDAGEALARQTGTSVVDSRYVVVRGLSDRYNTVVLNGARIPSSDPDRRAVNVDIFPGGLIGALVTSKTFSPDVPGESTGGYINIITKDIPEEDFIKFSVSVGSNTQSTGNDDFITRKGPGLKLLGTSREDQRALSDALARTDLNTAPNRIAAQALIDEELAKYPSPGITTKAPPLNFSLGGEVGKLFEFNGRRLGIFGAFTYSLSSKYDPAGFQGTVENPGVGIPGTVTDVLKLQTSSEDLLAGLLLGAGYEITDDDSVKLVYFGNLAAEQSAFFGSGLVEGNGPETVDPDGDEDLTLRNEFFVREASIYTERMLSTLQLSGEHIDVGENGAKVNWVAAYSQSYQDQPDFSFINYSVARGFLNSAGVDLANPTPGSPYERGWRRLDDDNYYMGLTADIPLFERGEKEARFKFGGNFDSSTREYQDNIFSYNLYRVVSFPTYNGPVFQSFDPDNTVATTPGDFLHLLADTGVPADVQGTVPPGLLSGGTSVDISSRSAYTANQNIFSSFMNISADLTENINLTAGFRVEGTDIQIATALEGRDTSLDSLFPLGVNPGDPVSINQVDVLPAMGVTWDYEDDKRLRMAASRTIARPSFKELAPIVLREPGTGRFFTGNPGLEMSTIDNVDLSWEWFPGRRGDRYAVNGFTKFIQNPIEFARGTADFFKNEPEAIVYGFELEAQTGLGFLDPALKPFDIGINYAVIRSQIGLTDADRASRRAAGLTANRRLQGQPDYIFNYNFTYDNEDLGLFAGIFLNVTGQLLDQAGGQQVSDVTPDVIQLPVTSLNFTVSKELTDRLKLTFRAENLTNEQIRTEYSTDPGVPEEVRRSGISYSLGVSGEW